MKFRNIKYALAMLGVSILAVSARSEIVSQKQAAKIAETFFNAAYGQYMSTPKMVWNGRQLTTDRLFAPFYIYNHPAGGFVIISSESKAFPILGYSKTSRFDRSALNDDENELLSQYAHEIELIRYDSRIPEMAIAAWQNIPLYINKVLTNPYDSPIYDSLSDDAKEKLETVDRRNNSIMMPSAVEFEIYNPENYRSYTLDDVTTEDSDEYIPFSLFEDFIAETRAEEQSRLAALDELISPSKPVVTTLGGAHYSIRFPALIKMARVYSIQGAKYQERYYNTDVVNLDLSSLPSGYYALLTLDENGKIYGLKLAR